MAKKIKKETILVLGAHSDDFVLGAGGTLAKYAKEGKKVISIVFSQGEKSHPWLKEHIVQKIRSKEALAAGKVLGCKMILFDLLDQKIGEEYLTRNMEAELLQILEKYQPAKIFTHSLEDPHPDHKAVHQITLDVLNRLTFKPEIYTYSVWNPVTLKINYPAMYINITKQFSLKIKALKVFHSQKYHLVYPFFLLIIKNLRDGWRLKTWFGEKFFRLR